MAAPAPAPLELPPLSPAFRREFQKLFVRLKANGLHVKDKVDRRVMAGELTYRDAWVVMADASDAADKAARVCKALADKTKPTEAYLRPQAQDFCVPNTAQHPLRAQLAYQREALEAEHQAGTWPMADDSGFQAWYAERGGDFPPDQPRDAAAASDDEADLATKMATLEKKLEEKVDTMRQILEVITSEMESEEQPAKRVRV